MRSRDRVVEYPSRRTLSEGGTRHPWSGSFEVFGSYFGYLFIAVDLLRVTDKTRCKERRKEETKIRHPLELLYFIIVIR